jgi:hypothetical protein
LKAWHLAVSKFPSQVWRSDVAIILDSIQYGSRFTSRMWSLWLKTKRYRRNSVNFEPLFLMLTILMRGLLCSNDDSNWVDLFILIGDIPIDISRLHLSHGFVWEWVRWYPVKKTTNNPQNSIYFLLQTYVYI